MEDNFWMREISMSKNI